MGILCVQLRGRSYGTLVGRYVSSVSETGPDTPVYPVYLTVTKLLLMRCVSSVSEAGADTRIWCIWGPQPVYLPSRMWTTSRSILASQIDHRQDKSFQRRAHTYSHIRALRNRVIKKPRRALSRRELRNRANTR